MPSQTRKLALFVHLFSQPATDYRLPATAFWLCFARKPGVRGRVSVRWPLIPETRSLRRLGSFGATASFVVTPQGVSGGLESPIHPIRNRNWVRFAQFSSTDYRLLATGYRLIGFVFPAPSTALSSHNSRSRQDLAALETGGKLGSFGAGARFVVTPQGVPWHGRPAHDLKPRP